MAKKKKRPETLPLLHQTSVACANECTGICPTVPETEEQARAYENIAPVFVTEHQKKKKH